MSFSPLTIAGYFFLHLFILCITYFNVVGGGGGGFVMFFQILGYLFLPFVIVLISYGSGRTLLLRSISDFSARDTSFQFLLSLGIGLSVFLTLLTILGSLGYYNLWSVLAILGVLAITSYTELFESCKGLWTTRIEFDNHRAEGSFLEQVNLPLLSTEFLFIILSFLVSVSFINIMRPMPIGWDDLGAYMNYPQIMANNGVIIP